MKHIGMTVAAMLVAGAPLLGPGSAHACEGMGTREVAARKGPAVKRPLEALDAVMAAKCQCGSAADCTCKKGSCECARCKKPRQVVDALSDQAPPPKLQDARYDASAGVFI